PISSRSRRWTRCLARLPSSTASGGAAALAATRGSNGRARAAQARRWRRRRHRAEERLVPELEREQRPELVLKEATLLEMGAEHPADRVGVEDALAPQPIGRQQVDRHLAQVGPQPFPCRREETHLALPGDLRREQVPERFFEDPLG